MHFYRNPNFLVNPNFRVSPYYPVPSFYPVNPGYYEDLSSRQVNLGTRWEVEEGGWRGVWTRRGNSNTFDGRWTRQGSNPITAVLTIQVFGDFVSISRRNSSDGNNCLYVGRVVGNRVTGQNVCTRGGGAWSATIQRGQQVPDLGRIWDVQEGAWRGVWTRRGNSNVFDARWTRQGANPITAVMTMEQNGNNVRILRRNSSDGNNCEYNGRIDGRNASGSFTCTQGGGQWSATIRN
ncbi:hypothetical protein [Robertmurraya sp. Marseille-Q9965]